MSAQHTPGPWDWEAVSANASGGHHLYLIDSKRRKIAALWGRSEEKKANARLIAAAPDLLEAMINLIDGTPHSSEAAIAAIAKAEGR